MVNFCIKHPVHYLTRILFTFLIVLQTFFLSILFQCIAKINNTATTIKFLFIKNILLCQIQALRYQLTFNNLDK